MKRSSYIQNNVLYVYYEVANYNEVITQAYKDHGIEPGTMQVICKPAGDMDMLDRIYLERYGGKGV